MGVLSSPCRRPRRGKWRFLRRSYVTCSRGWTRLGARRWHLRREPQLSDYVNPAWDEAVNCSSYRTSEIEHHVEARIRERSLADGMDYSCPVEPNACAKARNRYADFAERRLHPACLAAEGDARPWWRFW